MKASAQDFPLPPAREAFYRHFFPESEPTDWEDWHWQLACASEGRPDPARILTLSPQEQASLAGAVPPVRLTPHVAALIAEGADALRRSHLAGPQESATRPDLEGDPLGEDAAQPVPGLIRRFEDRAVFLTTPFCPVPCRFCTRRRILAEPSVAPTDPSAAVDWLENHPEIREVLVSGGEPLTLSDPALFELLGKLRAIDHIEVIRLATRLPVTLPMRITRELAAGLARFQPLWGVVHVNHVQELSPETNEALTRLREAGLPLAAQTVLLNGVNDSPQALESLFRGLLRQGVRPYTLFQCEPVEGAGDFRVPIPRARALFSGLAGRISGLALPRFVEDRPGGKVPLWPADVSAEMESGRR